jgi:hypothetical protein
MGKAFSDTHNKKKDLTRSTTLHCIVFPTHIIVQDPTKDDAAPILPTETSVSMSDGPNMNHTVKVQRKAAKRTLPFDLTAEDLLV